MNVEEESRKGTSFPERIAMAASDSCDDLFEMHLGVCY